MVTIKDIAAGTGLNVATVSRALGGYTVLASALAGDNIPRGMESDIHGTISNILLEKVCFHETPAYLADITVRHPKNDNAVLIWHSDAP